MADFFNSPLNDDKKKNVFNFSFSSEDFGRESLGILDLNHTLQRRESQFFGNINLNQSFGRESLGILDINNPDFRRDTIFGFLPRNHNIGRESLGILNIDDALFTGRESLSINALPSVPEISAIHRNSSINIDESTILNRCFLASVNSISPVFSISRTHEASQPSAILSNNESSNVLNHGFILETSESSKQNDENARKEVAANDRKCRSVDIITDKCGLDEPERACVSYSGGFNLDDDQFDDSVFIEAKHLASRIADGSMILDEANSDDDMLDSVHEPDNLLQSFNNSDCDPKIETDEVFKQIDRIVPKLALEISPVTNSQFSPTVSPKTPREMLSSLTAIIARMNADEETKSKCNKLIENIAEILVSSPTTDGSEPRSTLDDDSGHSSVANEGSNEAKEHQHNSYEVLDLRSAKKEANELSVSESKPTPLDLSMKSGSSVEKFLSPNRFPLPNSSLNRIKSASSSLLNGSRMSENLSMGSTNDSSRNLSDISGKFRQKKADSIKKSGPLKAVIPVDNMARRRSAGGLKTPTYNKAALKGDTSKIGSATTPVNEPKLKPMAQSTPDAPPLRAQAPYNTPLKSKIAQSQNTSLPLKQKPAEAVPNKSAALVRRNSVGELKKPWTGRTLIRSFSTGGKEPKLMSTLNKVRKEVAAIREGNNTSNMKKTENVATVLRENKTKSGLTRTSFIKSGGKENAVH